MNERRTVLPSGSASTNSVVNPAATSGAAQVVAYGSATPVEAPQPPKTQAVAVTSSRTVATSLTEGTLKLRYAPRKVPISSESTS
jgi:hypothetical protein